MEDRRKRRTTGRQSSDTAIRGPAAVRKYRGTQAQGSTLRADRGESGTRGRKNLDQRNILLYILKYSDEWDPQSHESKMRA
jgi:hypothetical protein